MVLLTNGFRPVEINIHFSCTLALPRLISVRKPLIYENFPNKEESRRHARTPFDTTLTPLRSLSPNVRETEF